MIYKRIIKIATILFLGTLTFSCNNDNHVKFTEDDIYFKVKIDGAEHVFQNNIFVNSSSFKIGLIAINPNDGKRKSISIVLAPDDTGMKGTFTEEFSASFIEDGQAGTWSEDRGNGTITITNNNDDFIEGTFSFMGKNKVSGTTKIFAEGEFKAKK